MDKPSSEYEAAKYWKVRALYYEALYRITEGGNKNDPFMLDDIGYPAYFMSDERVGKSEGGFASMSGDGSLPALSERERKNLLRRLALFSIPKRRGV